MDPREKRSARAFAGRLWKQVHENNNNNKRKDRKKNSKFFKIKMFRRTRNYFILLFPNNLNCFQKNKKKRNFGEGLSK